MNRININFLQTGRIRFANYASRLARKIPIEAYLLIIFPGLTVAILFILNRKLFSINGLLFYLFYANRYFIVIFVFLYIYFFIKIIAAVLFSLAYRKNKSIVMKLKNILKDQIYINAITFFSSALITMLLPMLGQITPVEKIVRISDKLIHYDKMIFGANLLFSMSHFINQTGGGLLGWVLLQSYNILSLFLASFVLILFLFNKTLTKKFLLFFFTITFIGIPIWYAMPVLNPLNRYIVNVLDISPPENISSELKHYNPDPVLSSYQSEFSGYYKKEDFLDVTSFPSMHAGYSVGIIIYGFLLWPPSLFITLPWFVLEMAGAVYLGQHYLIDLFFGSVVAVLAYFLVEWFFRIEKKYYTGKGSLFVVDTIQNDARKFFGSIVKIFPYEFNNRRDNR